MSEHFYWLYLEPFVHVFSKKNSALFYNSITGKTLEYSNSPIVIDMAKLLTNKKNTYSIKLSNDELQNPVIKRLVSSLRRHYMGDLLKKPKGGHKPFQMMPYLYIQHDVERFDSENLEMMRHDAKEYIQEITFQLSSNCKQNCFFCKNIYRQMTFCWKTRDCDCCEMPFDFIAKTIPNLYLLSSLKKMHFIGGNILEYANLQELLLLLAQSKIDTIFYINYHHIANQLDRFFYISTLNPNIQWVVFVDFDILAKPDDRLKTIVEDISTKFNLDTFHFNFVVQTCDDIDNEDKLIAETGITNYSTIPYFNGRNLTFFKQMVYTRKTDISDAFPSQQDIFARMKIHPLDFGRITIQSNGEVYANLNHEKIGNAFQESLNCLVFKEIHSGKSWRATRCTIEPCNGCVYELLCPPISNYEYAVGRHNLCNIKKEVKK